MTSDQDVLSRYSRAPEGRLIIDVSTERVEDLFHDFDRRAPYVRRELDPDLVDYLYDCAEEVGGEPFTIRFSFETASDEEGRARAVAGVPNHFLYLAGLERRAIRRMLRRSLLFLAFGVGLVTLAVWIGLTLKRVPDQEQSVIAQAFAEGLTIAAWVAVWEAVATVLIEWWPRRKARRVLERLAAAPLDFSPSVPAGAPA